MKNIVFNSILPTVFGSSATAHDLADIIQGAENGNVEAPCIRGGMYEIGFRVAK